MDKINILNVFYDNLTLIEATDCAYELAKGGSCRYIVTPNSEIVYAAQKDLPLKHALEGAALVVADGVGIIRASLIYKTPLKEKVAGIELGEALLARAAHGGEGVFLLGAKPGVAELAAEKLCAKYPGLIISGTQDGYFKSDEPIIEKINSSGARICLVCLGAPKQELWMERHAGALKCGLLIGLGGSLDVFAGASKRAPRIFIKLGLEWFYRLLREPQRIGRMSVLPRFIRLVKKDARKRGEK